MAFPANQLRLAPTLDLVANSMKGIKQLAQARSARMASESVESTYVLDLWEQMKIRKAGLQQLAAVPGIAAYAQSQYDDNTLDIAAEFNAVIAAMDAVAANIESTFPKDGAGYLLSVQFGASSLTPRTFAPASTATLRGLLDTLAGVID